LRGKISLLFKSPIAYVYINKKLPLMKTITVLLISSMVFFSIAAAPPHRANRASGGFTSLNTHRQGKGGAEVTWSFSSTNVTSFTVQRTNDDPTDPYSVWVQVGCVGCDGSRSYKCHDDHPFPGFVNYRVTALMNDQSTVTSQISILHIAAH
jgi:hypothetical protein